jgi:hypothetical protein
MYYSTLKRASSQRKVPELKEEDIEESFVRGSGPVGSFDVFFQCHGEPQTGLGWSICKQNREQRAVIS